MEPLGKILFVDVETTGLSESDKIVSFGAISYDSADFGNKSVSVSQTHLIFDPGISSHPKAESVHGYSDWILRYQLPFPFYAGIIKSLIAQHKLIVAHNARFDIGFLRREIGASGLDWPRIEMFCTMEVERSKGLQAGLDATCRRAGISTRGRRHSALDDAWRAMQVFLYQKGHGTYEPNEGLMKKPLNLRKVPRRPVDGVAARNPIVELKRIESVAEKARSLRREIAPALAILRWIIGGNREFSQDEKSEVRSFAKAECDLVIKGDIDEFAEMLCTEALMAPHDWGATAAAIDALRSDAEMRGRLTDAIERCIRVDGHVASDEIERLRQVASHFGGKIAVTTPPAPPTPPAPDQP